MANNVKPSEIIDIEGLIKDIATLETATGKYDATASKMLDTLSKRVTQYRKEIQDLAKALSGQSVDSDFTKQAKGLAEYKNMLQGLADAQERLSKSIDLSTASVNELKQRQKDLIKVNSALKSEVNQDTEAIKANEKALKDTSAVVNQLTSTMKTATKQVKFASGTYNELQQSLTNDIKALKNLDSAFTVNGSKVDVNKTKIKELTAAIKAKQDALKKVDAEMGINTRNVGNYSSAIGFLHGGIRGAIGSMGTWGLAIVAVTEAMQGLNSLILVGEELRRSQLGVQNVSTNALDASINLDFLRGVAQRLGLEIQSLNKDFKLFAGATEGTALEGAKTREIFDGIATAAAAMQLTVDDASGMFRAFSQMISKNTLQSEELKGQLAERLPSAIRLTAEALGITTEKLFEQMKAGKVLAVDVLPLLAKKFQDVYSQDAIKNVDTLTGSTNRLSNAWKEFLNSETSPISRFLSRLYNQISGVLELIERPDRGSKEERRRVSMASFSKQGNSGDMAAAFNVQKEASMKYIKEEAKFLAQFKKAGIDNNDSKRRQQNIDEELAFLKNMSDLVAKQAENEKGLIKTKNAANEKANQEAQEKAEKDAEKARNKKLIADRKAYQIELRENQAKEKEKLALLEISNIEGLISDEDYAQKRLDVENTFTNSRISLTKKYIGINSQLGEEMRDDEARNLQDLENNRLEFLKLKAKQLQEYYKQIKDDFIHSFDGMKGQVEADIKTAEGSNKSQFDLQRISIERNRRQKEQGKGGLKPSEGIGFDIQQTNVDIENIKQDTMSIVDIYMRADLLRIANKKQAIDKLDSAEGTLAAKAKARTDIELKDNKFALDLKANREKDLANKQIELSNKVTDKKISDEERLALVEKENQDKRLARISFGLEAMSSIFNGINDISRAYSENRISQLEKQKEYEVSLAGDNASAKAIIEERYQKKINEERLKQAKRDKANAIAQIILNTAIGVASALKTPATIPFIIALGAIQLATAIATPLPQYAKGKKKGESYKGDAVVGEKGAEIVEKNGKMTLFSEPSVTYVDPLTRVYTASETSRILNGKKLSNDNLVKEMEYNQDYTRKHSKAYLLNETMGRNFKNSDLSLLKRTLSSGIEGGFDKATIVINNGDGSTLRRKGNTNIKDNSRRSIYA